MGISGNRSIVRGLCPLIVAIGIAFVSAPSAQAAFHLWTLTEIYSNASGTLQFIEMHNANSNENFISFLSIQVSNFGNTQTNTYVIPGDPLPGNTANRSLLFGTAGIQAAGGPAPNYIIPNNFLFQAGGTISFFGANSGPYTALPTDGLMSRIWTGGNAPINSPTNYAGVTGVVNGVIPEPSTLVLSSLGIGFYGLVRSRWRRKSQAAQ